MKKVFFSYTYASKKGSGFGNCMGKWDSFPTITDMADYAKNQLSKQRGFEDAEVVILYFCEA